MTPTPSETRRLPVPDWTRPGETWRVESEPGDWQVTFDGVCSAKRCVREARIYRPRDDFALCADHITEYGMWIEDGRLVSWALRP